MQRFAIVLLSIAFVGLVGCGGGAASSGMSLKAGPSAEVQAARAEAEAQERKLSELRQEKAELEAQLEGATAPAGK